MINDGWNEQAQSKAGYKKTLSRTNSLELDMTFHDLKDDLDFGNTNLVTKSDIAFNSSFNVSDEFNSSPSLATLTSDDATSGASFGHHINMDDFLNMDDSNLFDEDLDLDSQLMSDIKAGIAEIKLDDIDDMLSPPPVKSNQNRRRSLSSFSGISYSETSSLAEIPFHPTTDTAASSPSKAYKRKRLATDSLSSSFKPWTLSDQVELDVSQLLELENVKLKRENNMFRKLLIENGIMIPGESLDINFPDVSEQYKKSPEQNIFDNPSEIFATSNSSSSFSVTPPNFTLEDDEAAQRAKNIVWVTRMEELERQSRMAERDSINIENIKERKRRTGMARILQAGEQLRRVNESDAVVIESLHVRQQRQKLASSATRIERKRRIKSNTSPMIPTRVGRWSKEEHELFKTGLSLYGRDWDSMATVVGTRSTVQIRSHAQKYFKKVSKVRADCAAKAAREAGLNGDVQLSEASKARGTIDLSTSQVKSKGSGDMILPPLAVPQSQAKKQPQQYLKQHPVQALKG